MLIPQFYDPLRLEAVPPNLWRTLEPYRYRTFIVRPEKGFIIRVPEDFENDLASIPRVFRRLIPGNGRERGASVIHDWLYKNKGKIGTLQMTRKQCDQIFLEAMKAAGVPLWKRQIMYRGVRTGGWVFFNKEAK